METSSRQLIQLMSIWFDFWWCLDIVNKKGVVRNFTSCGFFIVLVYFHWIYVFFFDKIFNYIWNEIWFQGKILFFISIGNFHRKSLRISAKNHRFAIEYYVNNPKQKKENWEKKFLLLNQRWRWHKWLAKEK